MDTASKLVLTKSRLIWGQNEVFAHLPEAQDRSVVVVGLCNKPSTVSRDVGLCWKAPL